VNTGCSGKSEFQKGVGIDELGIVENKQRTFQSVNPYKLIMELLTQVENKEQDCGMKSSARTTNLELPSHCVLNVFEQNVILKTLVCVVSLTPH